MFNTFEDMVLGFKWIPKLIVDVIKSVWEEEMKNLRLPIKLIVMVLMVPLTFIIVPATMIASAILFFIKPILDPLANIIARVLFKQEK